MTSIKKIYMTSISMKEKPCTSCKNSFSKPAKHHTTLMPTTCNLIEFKYSDATNM